MHHSTWDLEVHVREMQGRRLREANRARQIDAAFCRGDMRHQSSWFSISRFVSLAQTWLSPRRTLVGNPVDGVEAAKAPAAGRQAMPGAAVPANRAASPNRLSQPYAGMMVLVRGTDVQTAEQPCSVGDC